MRKHSSRRRSGNSQQNVSILSFSAICVALSGISAVAKKCDAHNEN